MIITHGIYIRWKSNKDIDYSDTTNLESFLLRAADMQAFYVRTHKVVVF